MIHVVCHPARVLSIPIKRNPGINILFALNFFTKNILHSQQNKDYRAPAFRDYCTYPLMGFLLCSFGQTFSSQGLHFKLVNLNRCFQGLLKVLNLLLCFINNILFGNFNQLGATTSLLYQFLPVIIFALHPKTLQVEGENQSAEKNESSV
jgi:hypothetical protein